MRMSKKERKALRDFVEFLKDKVRDNRLSLIDLVGWARDGRDAANIAAREMILELLETEPNPSKWPPPLLAFCLEALGGEHPLSEAGDKFLRKSRANDTA